MTAKKGVLACFFRLTSECHDGSEVSDLVEVCEGHAGKCVQTEEANTGQRCEAANAECQLQGEYANFV